MLTYKEQTCYNLVEEVQHLYGCVMVVENKNKELFLSVSSKMSDSQASDFEEVLRVLRENPSPSILSLVDYSLTIRSSRQGFHVVSQYFELPPDVIRNTLVLDSLKVTPLMLSRLLHSLVETGSYLHKNGMYIGCLVREVVHSFGDHFKLFPLPLPYLLSVEKFIKFARFEKRLLLSPELNRMIVSKATASVEVIQRSDVYALAVLLMQVTLKEELRSVPGSSEGFQQVVTDMFNKFKERVKRNRMFVSVVEAMLCSDPLKRPGFDRIKSRLPSLQVIEEYYQGKHLKSSTESRADLNKMTACFVSITGVEDQGQLIGEKEGGEVIDKEGTVGEKEEKGNNHPCCEDSTEDDNRIWNLLSSSVSRECLEKTDFSFAWDYFKEKSLSPLEAMFNQMELIDDFEIGVEVLRIHPIKSKEEGKAVETINDILSTIEVETRREKMQGVGVGIGKVGERRKEEVGGLGVGVDDGSEADGVAGCSTGNKEGEGLKAQEDSESEELYSCKDCKSVAVNESRQFGVQTVLKPTEKGSGNQTLKDRNQFAKKNTESFLQTGSQSLNRDSGQSLTQRGVQMDSKGIPVKTSPSFQRMQARFENNYVGVLQSNIAEKVEKRRVNKSDQTNKG